MSGVRAVAALCAVVFLAACSLTKSPAEGLNFAAPTGWQSTPGIMGRFQLWQTPGTAHKQMLMLFKLPGDAKMDAFRTEDLSEMNSSAKLKGAKIVEQRKMTICGNQDSMYMKMQGTSSAKKVEENVDTVLSKAQDGLYVATYIHPIADAPDAAAEAAIYELCPAKT